MSKIQKSKAIIKTKTKEKYKQKIQNQIIQEY